MANIKSQCSYSEMFQRTISAPYPTGPRLSETPSDARTALPLEKSLASGQGWKGRKDSD